MEVNNIRVPYQQKTMRTCHHSNDKSRWNPDRHIFKLLMILTMTFMVLFVVGTSVPVWYVLEEPVTNLSTCRSADNYVTKNVRVNWADDKTTKLSVYASLWYLSVYIENDDQQYRTVLPFVFVPRSSASEKTINDLVGNVVPKGVISLITFTLLGMGVIFSFSASNRPTGLVYYGLSAVLIVTAVTSWVLVAVPSSEAFVFSTAYDFCLQYGGLKTSLLLQTLTGAASVLAFILGFILIHLALLINAKINREYKQKSQQNDSTTFNDVMDQWRDMYNIDQQTDEKKTKLENKVYTV